MTATDLVTMLVEARQRVVSTRKLAQLARFDVAPSCALYGRFPDRKPSTRLAGRAPGRRFRSDAP